MTISYNWLSEYLPVSVDPERLSRILTSIGLEVESMSPYESIRGGLKGLVIGKVVACERHPNADKLSLTKVDIGAENPLSIVCGAPNVAVGQTVVVAPVGTTIYPFNGDPLTMKLAKIRGEESQGMICAEDEIGLGPDHGGILVLPDHLKAGTPFSQHFPVYTDTIYEIGLTPNRMDAMSHMGVARDVCAYLTHHDKKELRLRPVSVNSFKAQDQSLPIQVELLDTEGCQRYSGVSITGITVAESPQWLKDRLLSIGLRPINNIVDITNFVLHETGQPLHAFDASALQGDKIIVQQVKQDTPFITLDGKERKLDASDIMICDAVKPVCIAGVFGGLGSGVTNETKNVFLESAWFHPSRIRKTSFRHGLRTDAATRFEKGVDISQTLYALKRAALLIKELAGGTISSDIVDVYPNQEEKKQVAIKYHYLKKLSGKSYHPDTIKKILEALGFEVIKDSIDELRLSVPYHKPDISLPADIVEEILRIDGLDNVEIPQAITITPSVENDVDGKLKEKIAQYLAGSGFREILTNSITNSAYYTEEQLDGTVKMLNNLSAELNILRPSMMETAMEVISYNHNRKNDQLRLFEFGKTYSTTGIGNYREQMHCCIYLSGLYSEGSWRAAAKPADLFALKGVLTRLCASLGLNALKLQETDLPELQPGFDVYAGKEKIGTKGQISKAKLNQFDIKVPVFMVDLDWAAVVKLAGSKKLVFRELPRQIAVERDLAMLVNRSVAYGTIEAAIRKANLPKLAGYRLFDLFESDKLGADKKSVAINFSFLDEEKTMTDKEIDALMQKLIQSLEKETGAEIRKS
ncbi:phenylalanine--tRNA ligase subunit beta [Flavihumibacter cheonanensis]|uniref:phenylalanine--tRNA ligase subunit beta n=1 Tax=Flavihumibacter cheonanensis TaxID=1442385 RepID=UPI001EF7F6B7|nr:phenylalanine--tRNA ligase subunit beta [Flavihumibacter cheonanensis]MCG7753608.1 phenylalanine--tRNA ligase subunit beta [Flavihumibacter cheonanensis]